MNVAVVQNGKVKGHVHRAHCFIVTTRWPDRDWKAVQARVTCRFCGAKR